MSEKEEVVSDDEIDLVELARLIWSKRRFITKVTGIFVVLGLIIAFTSKVEYEASTKLLPESQGSSPNLGALGGLGGLVGIDLNLGEEGALNPLLYSQIVKTTPFLNGLLNAPIHFEKIDTTVSSFVYFKEIDTPSLLGGIAEYTIGLPGKIKQFFSSPEPTRLNDYSFLRYSKDDWSLIIEYSDRLSVETDSETGIIEIKSQMPDPVAAAQVTEILVDGLTKKVTDYKLGKVQNNLNFIEERFQEAKLEYEKKQKEVALFTDRNRNITNSFLQTEYERLQNELNIAFEVYKGLSTQLEQVKIQVKEETPVFTVMEPVRVPEDKSKPKRLLILILSTILGGAFSVFYIIVANYLNDNNE